MAILRKEEMTALAMKVNDPKCKEVPLSTVRDMVETLLASRKQNDTLTRRCNEYRAMLVTIHKTLESLNAKEAVRNMPKSV